MTDQKSDAILDTFGLFCPVPVIKAAKRINAMKVGEILEIWADDAGVMEDFPNWCRSTGHELLSIKKSNGASFS